MAATRELLEMHEKGLLTHGELVSKVIDLAADISPEALMAQLPSNLLDEIRNNAWVKNPPANPDELFMVSGVTYKPGIDITHAVQAERQRAFLAISALSSYFNNIKA